MRKLIQRLILLVSCTFFIFHMALPVYASDFDTSDASVETESSDDTYLKYTYTNPDTGYIAYIYDSEDLLSDSESEALLEQMKSITTYGNVGFESIYETTQDTSDYMKEEYSQMFGQSSGTIFTINMGNRNIWIHSNGNIYQTITNSYADTITDNVYSYASREEYYQCASVAFEQINTLLSGHRIAQPMKHISNILLAIIIAFLVNYILAYVLSHASAASSTQIMEATDHTCKITNKNAEFTHQTRVYSPPKSSSSGGGNGGGGGSSGGGGGGGGHSF